MWDLSQMVPELSLKTSRIGKAGTCQFNVVRNRSLRLSEQLPLNCGDVVRVWYEGQRIFYGYVFAMDESEDRIIKVTAYDQIRYLQETDTLVRTNVTATEIIRLNAMAAELRVGYLADTGHVIPKFSQDSQSRLDMIYKALDETLIAEEKIYVFYDDAGELTLRNITDMKVALVLGDDSLVYGFSTSRNIDSDTFNRIKLIKDNKETGERDAYIVQDSATIAKWGRLQYHQKVDEKMNEEQIVQLANRLIELRNREQRKFSIDAIGFVGIRAGSVVQITIRQKDIDLNFLVEECTHKFNGNEHTMQLELRVYG